MIINSKMKALLGVEINHGNLDDNISNSNWYKRFHPPLMDYYNCQGKGALESIETDYDFVVDDIDIVENDREEILPLTSSFGPNKSMEHEPPSAERDWNENFENLATVANLVNPKRPRSLFGANSHQKTTLDSRLGSTNSNSNNNNNLTLPKGLLQQARSDAAPFIVVQTLQARKREMFESTSHQTKNTEDSKKNKKVNEGKCFVNIPMSPKETRREKAGFSMKDTSPSPLKQKDGTDIQLDMNYQHYEIENEDESVEKGAEVLVAAATKWRMAKERHLRGGPLESHREEEEESRDRYSVPNKDPILNSQVDETTVVSITAGANAPPGSYTRIPDAPMDSANVTELHYEREGVTRSRSEINFNGNDSKGGINEDVSIHEDCSRQLPRDPPGFLTGRDEEVNSCVVKVGEEGDKEHLAPMYVYRLSESLKQLENQQQVNRSMLLGLKLRHQSRMVHWTEKQHSTTNDSKHSPAPRIDHSFDDLIL